MASEEIKNFLNNVDDRNKQLELFKNEVKIMSDMCNKMTELTKEYEKLWDGNITNEKINYLKGRVQEIIKPMHGLTIVKQFPTLLERYDSIINKCTLNISLLNAMETKIGNSDKELQ